MDNIANPKKKKILRKLNYKCPDCGAKALVKVERIIKKDGVNYTEPWIECLECEYDEKFRVSEKRNKEVFNPKW